MSIKHATTDYPVHDLIAQRYSPYVFDPRPVSGDDLKALFEAARWSASSFNEQPWRYIVAARDDADGFAKMLSCLSEPNQAWAKDAGVLALGVVKTTFTHNEKPNGVALHDLGAASASLTLEATARGLSVHQMAGIFPDTARKLYQVPDGYKVMTALAIGYAGDPKASAIGERDTKPRTRRPLSDLVFAKQWGKPAG